VIFKVQSGKAPCRSNSNFTMKFLRSSMAARSSREVILHRLTSTKLQRNAFKTTRTPIIHSLIGKVSSTKCVSSKTSRTCHAKWTKLTSDSKRIRSILLQEQGWSQKTNSGARKPMIELWIKSAQYSDTFTTTRKWLLLLSMLAGIWERERW